MHPEFHGDSGAGCCWADSVGGGIRNLWWGTFCPCCVYGAAFDNLHNHEAVWDCGPCSPYCPRSYIGVGACLVVAVTDFGVGFVGDYVSLHDKTKSAPATASEQCSMCCVSCCPLCCWQPCQITGELTRPPTAFL